jgi:surface antigen/Mor family transcriptional regulator
MKPNLFNNTNTLTQQKTPTRRRKSGFPKIKPSVMATYFGVFAIVVAVVAVGSYVPETNPVVANAIYSKSTIKNEQSSVDSVVATTLAASVAQSVNLPIATSVANLAVSAQTQSEFAQASALNNTKPQITISSSENRSVIKYTVKSGDTIEALAKKYKISTQTIKWANDMTSNTLTVGDVIRILPIDGVLYDVKSGDTIASISKKYGVDKTRLVVYNDLDVSGLKSNTSIILPDGILPTTERPGYVAPVVINYFASTGTGFGGQTWYISTGTPDNGLYAHGNCTLYAYNRRVQLGLPVGDHWGNANAWAYNASLAGLTVSRTPTVGAIMQNGGYLGHVAIVESILPNGDLSVSEMNAYVSGGGYNIVSGRTVPAGNIGQYLFIK